MVEINEEFPNNSEIHEKISSEMSEKILENKKENLDNKIKYLFEKYKDKLNDSINFTALLEILKEMKININDPNSNIHQ